MATTRNVKCPLCLGPFTDPRLLKRCMHSFCKDCLCKYAEQILFNDKAAQYSCPLCTTGFQGPQSFALAGQWSEELPSDGVLLAVIERQSNTAVSCGPCYSKGIKSAAKSCKQCCEPLCDDCATIHRSFRSFRSHDVVDLDNAVTLPPVSDDFDKCHLHTEQRLEYFCKTHSELVCSKCALANHRACMILQSGEALENIKVHMTMDTERMISDLERLKTNLITKERKFQKDNIHLQEDALAEIEEKRQKINALFDRYKKTVISDLKAHADLQSTKIAQIKKDNESLIIGIDNTKAVLENLVKTESLPQTLIRRQAFNLQLNGTEIRIEQLNSSRPVTSFEHRFSLNTTALAEGTVPIGKFIVKTNQTDANEIKDSYKQVGVSQNNTKNASTGDLYSKASPGDITPSTATNETRDNVGQNPDSEKKGFLISNIRVKTISRYKIDNQGGYKPFLGGATFLQDDRVVIIDANNRKIALFSKSFEYLTDLLLSHPPRQVAAVDKDEVVIINDDRLKQIVFMKITGQTLSINRIIEVKYYIKSICFCNCILYAIAYEKSIKDGLVLISITPDGKTTLVHAVKTLLAGDHVKVFKEGDELYILCGSRIDNTVTYQSLKGEHRFSIRIMGPCGFDIDKFGNCFIASCMTHKIHVVSPDGRLICRLETGKLKKPYLVRFNSSGEKVLVTQYENSEVCVFGLSYHLLCEK